MGLWRGIFLALPLGIYFGEKNLKFPLRLEFREHEEIGLVFEYKFVYTLAEDISDFTKSKSK